MGNILDDNHLGEATARGEVIGRGINFRKRYLMGKRHLVLYSGTISAEENYLQGKWRIGASYSGTWEAHRSDETWSLKLETDKAGKLLQSSGTTTGGADWLNGSGKATATAGGLALKARKGFVK